MSVLLSRRLSTARAAPRRGRRPRLDGAGDLPSGEAGLVEARDVASLRLIDCAFEHAQGYALRLERCGGRFERYSFRDLPQSAIHSLDATELTIADNDVDGAPPTAWRSGARRLDMTARSSGTIASGASAPTPAAYRNAISVFRARGVSAHGNVIRGAGFSASHLHHSEHATLDNEDGDGGQRRRGARSRRRRLRRR